MSGSVSYTHLDVYKRQLDHLAHGDIDVAYLGPGVEAQPELVKRRRGALIELAPVHEAQQPDGGFATHENVLSDAHVGRQGELLVNDRDACRRSVPRVTELDRAALKGCLLYTSRCV